MKTYVITLSKTFLKGHPKCGRETNFASKFAKGQLGYISKPNKIHTIRRNYDLWKKRIQEVEEGKAILSIRQWVDKPYRSKQEILANLTNKDGVGIQLLDCSSICPMIDGWLLDDFQVISGAFEVVGVRKANLSEIFEDETGDRWYKCKLAFITLDEKSGFEKRTTTNVLVQAGDLREAVTNLDAGMKGTMADYVIISVAETAIMDLYPYSAEPDVKPEFPVAGEEA